MSFVASSTGHSSKQLGRCEGGLTCYDSLNEASVFQSFSAKRLEAVGNVVGIVSFFLRMTADSRERSRLLQSIGGQSFSHVGKLVGESGESWGA